MCFDTLGHDYTEGVVCHGLAELKTFWAQVYRGPFRIIYRPQDPETDFAEVCELVRHAGDMTFVVEEVTLFFKAGGQTAPEFNWLVNQGRHADVEMLLVTQRPKGIGRFATAMAKEFYVFHTREPDDLKYFSDRLGQDIADQLPGLEQYHYLHYQDYGGLETKYTIAKDPA